MAGPPTFAMLTSGAARPALARIAVAWVVAVALTVAAPAQAAVKLSAPESVGLSSEKLRAMSAFMHAAVDQGRTAGVVTLVARRGQVVHFDVYGGQQVGADGPLREDSIFRIMSMTKPITAVALLTLYEEGGWDLDDPIAKFIPEFRTLKVRDAMGKLSAPGRPPTMRDLMNYTAGFDVTDGYRNMDLRSGDLKLMIERLALTSLPVEPGKDWRYGPSVDIQGYLVEQISGQTLGAFMKQRIFDPLGMTDTAFHVPQAKLPRLVALHGLNARGEAIVAPAPPVPLVDPLFPAGGGGLFSTAEDFWRFAQMLANGGEFEGKRILRAETVKLMHTDTLAPGVGVDLWGPPMPGVGFGLNVAVIVDPAAAKTRQGPGSFFWFGAYGTWFWVDPANELVVIGLIQTLNGTRPDGGGPPLRTTSIDMTYDAIDRPLP